MKSLVDLLEYLLQDCGRRSGAPYARDVETLRTRVKHEGDSFITITLPSYCRDFERCLDEGRIVPGLFLSFGKLKSGIPEFLQGFLHNVFDSDGTLSLYASAECIRSIRQICLFGKKILRPCSPERERDAADAYARCDCEVALPSQLGTPLYDCFKRVADVVMSAITPEDPYEDFLVPVHGPGATRERISGNQKWVFRRWHVRLERANFSFHRFGLASIRNLGSLKHLPLFVEPEDEEPVRVVFVPKTQKTPRVIAVEPVCMQYAQQALARWLVRQLETCRFTAGHVNFRDQSVNQALALDASGTRHLATLDMSEASDRVSVTHVSDMLESLPRFRELVLSCRSTRAQLPNGEILSLQKFASMGSALCFPMEALVFYMSIIASRLTRAGICPTPQSVYSFSRSVYVYGDDLIVPADEASAICDDLESLGFKVNRHKSFWTGKFRESCGSDCYDNELVTPVYLRRDLPTSRKDASGLLSAVATANQLFQAGYTATSAAIRKAVEAILGPLPQVPADSPAIGWWCHSSTLPPVRRNVELQRREYLCWVPVTPRDPDPLDGDPALAKCFRLIGSKETIDKEHLDASSRPYGLALKRRWVPCWYL